MTAPDTRWEARAACRNASPALWSDDDPRGKDHCLTRCPVLAQCLTAAMRTEEPGARAPITYGALTSAERAALADDQALLGGQWDADEARLIALESADTARRVQKIAQREKANRITERLASRMLGRRLDPAAVIAGRRLAAARSEDIQRMVARGTGLPKLSGRLDAPAPVVQAALEVLGLTIATPGSRRIDELLARADELRALRARNVSVQGCADAMGFPYNVVKHGLSRLRRENLEVAA